MFKSPHKFDLSPQLKLGVGRGYSKNKVLKLSAILCLFLALGLTVNTVRILFSHHNPADALSTPKVLGASDIRTEQAEQPIQFVQYKVQKGDTLFDISQKNGIDWTALAALNNLQSPFTLKAGQIINIPKQ